MDSRLVTEPRAIARARANALESADARAEIALVSHRPRAMFSKLARSQISIAPEYMHKVCALINIVTSYPIFKSRWWAVVILFTQCKLQTN